MPDCVFCEIVQGTKPASVVYEDDATLAFMNLGQANPGHVLVIPKRHFENIYELDAETAGRLFQTTVTVARAVRDCFRADGLNVWQSNGRAGGQSVFHVHIHIFPRRWGDGLLSFGVAGAPAQPRALLDELAAKIRAHL